MADLTKLLSIRAAYRGHVTRILTQLGDMADAKDVDPAVTSSIEKQLGTYENTLHDLDTQILQKLDDEGEITTEVSGQCEIRDKITAGIVSAQRLTAEADDKSSVHSNPVPPEQSLNTSQGPRAMSRRLPELQIPKFTGDPLCYVEFWDSFKHSIDEDDSLSDCVKLQYLKSLTTDDAAATISGLSITDANYTVGVSLLKERFGQPQVIISAHVNALLNITPSRNNVKTLRSMFTQCEMHIRCLAALGVSADKFGVILAPIVLSKIPPDVRIVLSRANGANHWDLDKLRSALKDEIEAQEREGVHVSTGPGTCRDAPREKVSGTQARSTTQLFFANAQKPEHCAFCGEKHTCDACPLDIDARWDVASRNGLCFICLRPKHRASACRNRTRCDQCNRWHHVALCRPPVSSSRQQESTAASFPHRPSTNLNPEPAFTDLEVSQVANHSAYGYGRMANAALQTASATVWYGDRSCRARILFDTGATCSFCTLSLLHRLKAECQASPMMISTFGGEATRAENSVKADIYVQTYCGVVSLPVAGVEAIQQCLPRVTLTPEEVAAFNSLPNAVLADQDQSNYGLAIDVIVGMDFYYDFVTGPPMALSSTRSGLKAVPSTLGWLICGVSTACCSVVYAHCVQEFDVSRFWRLEALGIDAQDGQEPSAEDTAVLEHFESNVTYDAGRYSVCLPWKSLDGLPSNQDLAYGRFQGLLRRLKCNPDRFAQYDAVIREQLRLGFIETVPPDDHSDFVHYLPHHAVVREDHATTKLRIVYDCSSKRPGGSSLNNMLYSGPDLLVSLVGLLLRFRLYSVGISADIEKAFLMIGLSSPRDRNATRFFWVSDVESCKIIVLRFCRVLFGAICSPFLLNATIRHHLQAMELTAPVCTVLLNSFYMDNMILSLPSAEAVGFYQQAKTVLSRGGMNLREWATNSLSVLNAIPDADRGYGLDNPVARLLGLQWDTQSDTLMLKGLAQNACHLEKGSFTKRGVLRIIASVFDPLGFATPVTIYGKMFLQKLWLDQVSWDEELSGDMVERWCKICEQLLKVKEISVSRVLNPLEGTEFQLHTFADASKDAYAAAVYLRVQKDNETIVNLLMSKSRVTPIKGQTLTIPRLELMAVMIAVRLLCHVKQELHLPATEIVWTDSQIVLYWLKSDRQLKQFVGNRIREIRSADTAVFRHVPTKDNPADLPSRGCTVDKLLSSNLWWHGPEWLAKTPDQWPVDEISPDMSAALAEMESMRPLVHSQVNAVVPLEIVRLQNTFLRTVRVFAWVQRAIGNFKGQHLNGSLTAVEIDEAKLHLLKLTQAKYMDEWQTKGLLRQLGGFVSNDGLVRCMGRLQNSDISYNAKHPILLPRNDGLTALVVDHVHKRIIHQGVRHTLTAIRQEYWIPQGRQVVQARLRHCVTCKKWEGKPYGAPDSPPLPDIRVSEDLPFSIVGVDYAGPLLLKTKYDEAQEKAYILLFTCASSRAVHLELTDSLNVDDFMLAWRRFVARRLQPKKVVSDNAKTFKAASKKLANDGVSWIFNCDRAPWWGGFFERAVGLVKRALRKSLGKRVLTSVELATELSEVESVLNNRPLTYVSGSIADGHPLTPNMLCGQGISTVARDTTEQLKLTRRAQMLKSLAVNFWRSWRHEYLTALREHHKHRFCGKQLIDVGDVVIIKEDKIPRGSWRLGLIEQTVPGRDGQIRSARVKTQKGTILRPITLLCPLEVSTS